MGIQLRDRLCHRIDNGVGTRRLWRSNGEGLAAFAVSVEASEFDGSSAEVDGDNV